MQVSIRYQAFVFALVWAASGEALAEGRTCTLDTEFYASRANELASAHPGARIDAVTGSVSWTSSRHGQVEVQVGGCENFGLRVLSISELAGKGEQDTRKYAAELVRSYWPEGGVRISVCEAVY